MRVVCVGETCIPSVGKETNKSGDGQQRKQGLIGKRLPDTQAVPHSQAEGHATARTGRGQAVRQPCPRQRSRHLCRRIQQRPASVPSVTTALQGRERAGRFGGTGQCGPKPIEVASDPQAGSQGGVQQRGRQRLQACRSAVRRCRRCQPHHRHRRRLQCR
jgi:hypothetical protein